jgi:hypothetical protein
VVKVLVKLCEDIRWKRDSLILQYRKGLPISYIVGSSLYVLDFSDGGLIYGRRRNL